MSKDNLDLVKKTSQLSNLTVSADEEKELQAAFAVTMEVMDQLQKADVTGVEPTARLGQDSNRWRADEVDFERMFTQEQALANAQRIHNGYFVVGRLIDHEA